MARQGITLVGSDEFIKKIEALRTDNPGFNKRLRAAIGRVIKEVRSQLSKEAASGLEMEADPRQSYKAVRSAVYRRIFGGQVNILQSRRAGSRRYYEPPRHPSHRGGNRMKQSDRTRDLMSYQGKDRGFILRFLNAGTAYRGIHSYTGKDGHSYNLRSASSMNIKTRGLSGNRGRIAARNWFGQASQKEMERAAEQMQILIDRIIQEDFV